MFCAHSISCDRVKGWCYSLYNYFYLVFVECTALYNLRIYSMMGKKRHGVTKYPEVEEKIRSGEFTVREASNRSKNTCSVTWTQMRYIFDEEENELANYFFL